jgi:hypothetical protein
MLFPAVPECQGSLGFRDTTAGRGILELGSPATMSTTYGFVDLGGGISQCQALPGKPAAQFFTATAFDRPEVFVASLAFSHDGPASQRIHAVYLEYADGARQRRGLTDSELDITDCAVVLGSDGVWRCMPHTNRVEPTLFADPQCSQSAVWAVVDRPEPYVARPAGTCGEPTRIHALGTALTDGPFTRDDSGQCVKVMVPPHTSDLTLYSVGDEIAPSRFAAFRQITTVHGRITQTSFVNDDGVTAEGLEWDNELRVPCHFAPTEAGLRCVPSPTPAVFADVGCGVPIASPPQDLCDVAPPATPLISLWSGAWCARRLMSFELGDPAETGTPARVYLQGPGGTCPAYGNREPYRSVGKSVAADTFEPGSEVIE